MSLFSCITILTLLLTDIDPPVYFDPFPPVYLAPKSTIDVWNTINKTLLKLLTQSSGIFCYHSSTSMTISSTWYESCNTIFSLKIKKVSSLTFLCSSSSQFCRTVCSPCFCMLLQPRYSPISVIMTKIKGVQTGDPKIKIVNIF